MKKTEMIKLMENNNATLNNDGVYVINKNDFDCLMWDCDENDVKIEKTETKNVYNIKSGRNVLTINVKNNRNKTEKTKTETKTETGNKNKNVSGGHGVKSKNAHYIIQLKMVNGKPETITNITNCTDVKLWLKTLNKKSIEYLRIYDMLNNPCRKSAWVERDVVNG